MGKKKVRSKASLGNDSEPSVLLRSEEIFWLYNLLLKLEICLFFFKFHSIILLNQEQFNELPVSPQITIFMAIICVITQTLFGYCHLVKVLDEKGRTLAVSSSQYLRRESFLFTLHPTTVSSNSSERK